MKYKQLKEISAEGLVKDRPHREHLARYLQEFGYSRINYLDTPSMFDRFIEYAVADGWIWWLVQYNYIREVEEEIKAKVEVFYHIGQEFEYSGWGNGKQFLLSQVDTHKVALIGITRDKGNRCAPVLVNDCENITEEEFYEITGHKPQQFTLMPSCL